MIEATNSFHCYRYIEANHNTFAELAPSKQQRAHAYEVGKRYRVQVPRQALLKKDVYEEWIALFRAPELAQVVDIFGLLGWGTRQVDREFARQGFDCPDGAWYRSDDFINLMIKEHGYLLHDKAAALRAKRKRAEEMLRKGYDLFSVADNLQLSDAEVAEIENRVEVDPDMVDFE